jgi:SAM-dependent methyltransferase
MRTVDQYVLRVLGDQWAAPARTPSLLDVSRDGDGIAAELGRVGFRVTRVTLDDSSLETVGERLAGIHRHFDAVVVRDVLEAVDDWRDVVSRSVRRLRPGGVFVYGVSAGSSRPWLSRLLPRRLRPRGRPLVPAGELVTILRRCGLLQRETISLTADALDPSTTTYIGYSIMRGDPALATEMRWDFTGTGERWVAGARG